MTTPFDHKVWSQPKWLHYAVGVLLALLFIALRIEMSPIVGEKAPYAAVLIPVAIAAYAGGFWPGMLTSLIGTIGSVNLIVLPMRDGAGLGFADVIQMSFTLVICVFICFICGRLRMSAMRNSRLHAQMMVENAQVRDVLESITDAFCAVGKDWKILQANPAFVTSFCAEGVTADGALWDCISREGSSNLAAELTTAMTQRTTRQLEWQDPVSGDWYHVRAFPTALALSVFFHNITTRKQLDETRDRMLEDARTARLAAEEASRLKEEFLATISHELRTPMTSLVGWSEILAKPDVSPERLREGLASIEQSAKAQAKLVDELLDVSRITSGKLKVELSYWPLADLVEEAVRVHQPAAQAKGVDMKFVGSTELELVQVDGTRVHQVLSNLISNAIKFTPQGGSVVVCIHPGTDTVAVVVEDSGEGIPAEFLPHVFDRFRQANASTSRKYGGLGLGLAISKELVELHGGRIELRSEGVGKGTTVIVHLPRARDEHLHHKFGENRSEPADLTGLKILVVEDDEASRLLIRRLLEDHGADVLSTSGALEAFKRVVEYKPHVVVSDIGMPDIDGYGFARMMRERDDEWANVPLLALTAFAKDRDRTSARRAGFNDLITKPIDVRLLVDTLYSLANHKP